MKNILLTIGIIVMFAVFALALPIYRYHGCRDIGGSVGYCFLDAGS